MFFVSFRHDHLHQIELYFDRSSLDEKTSAPSSPVPLSPRDDEPGWTAQDRDQAFRTRFALPDYRASVIHGTIPHGFTQIGIALFVMN